MSDQAPTDYSEPVAYDKEGRPLYAHPQTPTPEPQKQSPQIVQAARPAEREPVVVSEEIKALHAESLRKYPNLNLSEGEYVINEVRRHPIGLFPIVGITVIAILIVVFGLMFYPMFAASSATPLPAYDSLILPAILLIILFAIIGYAAVTIYLNNKFFLTNESVIQEIQTTLFAHDEQTVSLSNIEDASYKKTSLLQTLFDYGSIRLSTEGDETTYRFNYVSNPKKQIATLNNAVEAFKNGQPVTND